MKKLTYTNGDEMPILGLGTWKSEPGEVRDAIIAAIKAGYRHIDCAPIYKNEAEIGEALSYCMNQRLVKREELWITSKLWNDCHKREHVVGCLLQTLQDLQLDYLELYLIHWPIAFTHGTEFPDTASGYLSLSEVPLTETWNGMQQVQAKGLAKHIGVSNFNQPKLQQLLDMPGQPPEMNQIELHPMLQQSDLVNFCQNNRIHVTAYSPLGSMDRSHKGSNEPMPLENELINELAGEIQATPAQILLAWQINRGVCVIPKSTNAARIQENYEAASVLLSNEAMERIATLDTETRIIDGSIFIKEGNGYSLDSIWKH